MISRTRAVVVLSLLAVLIGARGPPAPPCKLSIGNPSLEHFDTDGGVQIDFG